MTTHLLLLDDLAKLVDDVGNAAKNLLDDAGKWVKGLSKEYLYTCSCY